MVSPAAGALTHAVQGARLILDIIWTIVPGKRLSSGLPASCRTPRGFVLSQLAVQGGDSDLELFGGRRLVSLICPDDCEDVIALDVFERAHLAGPVSVRDGDRNLFGEIIDVDATAPGEHHGPLDGVFELAHVARPPVAQELVGGRRRDARDLPAHALGCVLEKSPR